jgi:hypothetical protein
MATQGWKILQSFLRGKGAGDLLRLHVSGRRPEEHERRFPQKPPSRPHHEHADAQGVGRSIGG